MPTNGEDQLLKEAKGVSERWETGVESSRGVALDHYDS